MSSRPVERRARRCPVCGRAADAKSRPFCSKHCADIDLARWLEGRYAIPAQDTDDTDSGAKSGDAEDEV